MTDLKRFEYVLALSECMNFSQAASQLNISQSTLSQYIQKLEKEIGVSLFDRSATPLKLTQYGEIYVKGARKILDTYCETLDSIGDADSGAKGTVRVGLSPSRATFLLPEVVSAFKELYPDVTLKFIESKSKDIIKNLNEGNIDFAYTVTDDMGDSDDFTVIESEREEIMLVCAASGEIAKRANKGVIDFGDTADLKFILLEDSQLISDIFSSLCKKSAVYPERYISVSELSTAISLVESSVGVMLLPSSYKGYGRLSERLSFFRVKQADFKRTLGVVYRRDKYLNKPAKALMKIMCKEP